ncbi:MAG: hypothetical protein AAB875_07430 [Patescibacteria group bacterium]
MAEIAEIYDCSIHKVVYWMDKYRIERRTWSEATYVKRNPDGDPFKIKNPLSPSEILLFGLGMGIYWGEGDKVTRHSIRVCNTDSRILKVFIRFLLEICQLKRKKITYSIICFNDTNPDDARGFWARELKISPAKFGKITQIPPQGKGTYKRKSKFGVCTVQASNLKLKSWLMNQIVSV